MYCCPQLDIMNQLKMSHGSLPPILISMARTYQDLKRYDQAINYYCQEAKIQQQLGNFNQVGSSLPLSLSLFDSLVHTLLPLPLLPSCFLLFLSRFLCSLPLPCFISLSPSSPSPSVCFLSPILPFHYRSILSPSLSCFTFPQTVAERILYQLSVAPHQL